jgi:hypothetical protein
MHEYMGNFLKNKEFNVILLILYFIISFFEHFYFQILNLLNENKVKLVNLSVIKRINLNEYIGKIKL